MSDESAYIASERVEHSGTSGMIVLYKDNHGYLAVFRCSCGQGSGPGRGKSISQAADKAKLAFQAHCACDHAS